MAGQRTQQLADRIKVIVASMLEREEPKPKLKEKGATQRVPGREPGAGVKKEIESTPKDSAKNVNGKAK